MNSKHFFPLLMLATLLFSCSGGGEDTSSPNSNPNPDPNPTPTKVSYNGQIKSIVSNHCLACHKNPPINGAPMALTTYSDVKNAVENRGLLGRINSTSNPMPPAPNSPLSSAEKDLFQQWKDQGFLEN